MVKSSAILSYFSTAELVGFMQPEDYPHTLVDREVLLSRLHQVATAGERERS